MGKKINAKEAKEEPKSQSSLTDKCLIELISKTKLKLQENKPLGKGGYSTVYPLLSQNGLNEFAGKIMTVPNLQPNANKSKFNLKKKLAENDALISTSLKHRNIIPAYSAYQLQESSYAIIMQRANGTLLGVTSQFYANKVMSTTFNKNPYWNSINENVAKYLCNQILDGLHFLRNCGFVHFDLKPDNVLLCVNVLKISDFTLTRYFNPNEMNGKFQFTGLGSRSYLPPECYKNELIKNELADRIDSFGFGCILFRILFNRFVIDEFETTDKRSQEATQFIENSLSYANDVCDQKDLISQETKEFLEKALNSDSNKRASIIELATDDWRFGGEKQELNKTIEQVNSHDYKKMLVELQKGQYIKKSSKRCRIQRRKEIKNSLLHKEFSKIHNQKSFESTSSDLDTFSFQSEENNENIVLS